MEPIPHTRKSHSMVRPLLWMAVACGAAAWIFIVFNLLLPLLLGSWVALAPAIGVVALLVWRTATEDRFLAGNLPGYGAYAARVHHRLIPGVW